MAYCLYPGSRFVAKAQIFKLMQPTGLPQQGELKCTKDAPTVISILRTEGFGAVCACVLPGRQSKGYHETVRTTLFQPLGAQQNLHSQQRNATGSYNARLKPVFLNRPGLGDIEFNVAYADVRRQQAGTLC